MGEKQQVFKPKNIFGTICFGDFFLFFENIFGDHFYISQSVHLLYPYFTVCTHSLYPALGKSQRVL